MTAPLEVVLPCLRGGGRTTSLARPRPLMPKTKAKKSAAAGSTPGVPLTTEARELHGTTCTAFGSEAGPSNEPPESSTSWQEAEDDREPPGKRQAAAGHRTGSELAQTSGVLGGRGARVVCGRHVRWLLLLRNAARCSSFVHDDPLVLPIERRTNNYCI